MPTGSAIRIWRTEIVHTAGRILRDAEEALGLPHDPSRLTLWLEHARRSTLTGQGKALLERRLGRYLHASERPDRPETAGLASRPSTARRTRNWRSAASEPGVSRACLRQFAGVGRTGWGQGRVAVCRATMPPVRLCHRTRSQPGGADPVREAGLVGPGPDRLGQVDVGVRGRRHRPGDRRQQPHQVLDVDGPERRQRRPAELADHQPPARPGHPGHLGERRRRCRRRCAARTRSSPRRRWRRRTAAGSRRRR